MSEFYCQFTFYDDSHYHFYVECDSIVNAYLKAINVFNKHGFDMVQVNYFNIERV